MSTIFLYPCNPLYKSQIDEGYYEEFNLAKQAGLEVHLIDIENIGNCNIIPPLINNPFVVYRGWMLNKEMYGIFEERFGKQLLTSQESYLNAHYFSHWYYELQSFTMHSIITDQGNVFNQFEKFPGKVFIKDFVKSIKTGKGSIIDHQEDLSRALSDMKHFRGCIEGGIVLREVIDLIPHSETRFFVVNNVIFSPRDDHRKLNLAEKIVKKLVTKNLKFYSIDIATTQDGKDILIEIGDGQVSDYIGWKAGEFISVLSAIAQINNS